MKNVDSLLDNKSQIGYVYFVYSDIKNRIYVGETCNISRIDIYKSIIECQDSKERIRLYRYYSKHNTISNDLIVDLVNKDNNFKIEWYETKYHKIYPNCQ